MTQSLQKRGRVRVYHGLVGDGTMVKRGGLGVVMLKWFRRRPPDEPVEKEAPLEIPAEELRQLLEGGHKLFLLDLRDQMAFRKGHIKGSQLIPFSELNNRMYEVKDDRLVIALCQSGRRSKQAARLLRTQGYDARFLGGGLAGWSGKLVR